MKPDLSFVIPVYNGEPYLAEAIGSCIGQSHQNIEIVVVNDHSTDGTEDIIKFYADKDKRVTPVNNHNPKGRGCARNIGTSIAKAPIIAVLDADDMAAKHRVKDTLELMQGEVIVHGAAAHIDCLSREHYLLKMVPFDIERVVKEGTTRITHSTVAYPKSIWERVRYDEEEYAELGLDDIKFFLGCAAKGYKFVGTDKVLSAYRFHEKAITQTRDEKRVLELKKAYLNDYKIQPVI